MRKAFRTLALSALVVTAVSAMSNAEAWSFGTQLRSPGGGDYRGRPEPSGSGGGFSFGYSTGGFDSCSQPYGGFYSHCRYGGSSFGPSINHVPPTYEYPSGFYNGYEDGYYRGYYDGNRNRFGRRHQRFRSR